MTATSRRTTIAAATGLTFLAIVASGRPVDESATSTPTSSTKPNIVIDGLGPHWRELGEGDFVNVNCDEDTWTWDGSLAKCTGKPVGVIRLAKPVTNVELVVEWRHLSPGGNSGVFFWASPESIGDLEQGRGRLPHGIEVQVLDLDYGRQYTEQTGKPADWFTSHGDVFPTGPAKMTPCAQGGEPAQAQDRGAGGHMGGGRDHGLAAEDGGGAQRDLHQHQGQRQAGR